ncbi:hypothetical protein M2E15_5005 [Bacillus mycoides]|nr:hypothetical protein M2E15_5005 [Bacillus mycoides]
MFATAPNTVIVISNTAPIPALALFSAIGAIEKRIPNAAVAGIIFFPIPFVLNFFFIPFSYLGEINHF